MAPGAFYGLLLAYKFVFFVFLLFHSLLAPFTNEDLVITAFGMVLQILAFDLKPATFILTRKGLLFTDLIMSNPISELILKLTMLTFPRPSLTLIAFMLLDLLSYKFDITEFTKLWHIRATLYNMVRDIGDGELISAVLAFDLQHVQHCIVSIRPFDLLELN